MRTAIEHLEARATPELPPSLRPDSKELIEALDAAAEEARKPGADEIIRSFYTVDKLTLKNGAIQWAVGDSIQGLRAAKDITVGGEVVTHAGRKITSNALAALKKGGLLPFANYNRIHVVPPCVVTADEVAEALEIYDAALATVRL